MTSRDRVEEILTALDAELVGLASVKQDVQAIAFGLLDLQESSGGSTALSQSVHCVFAGPPGVGKATVALRLARVLHALGRLRAPRVHRVTRDDLVAPFVGYTEANTAGALRESAGGVLLVDEAYELLPDGHDRDHGQEAVELLAQAMRTPADLTVVLAGDARRLERFLTRAPELRSLTSHALTFPNYEHGELLQIADMVLVADGFRFDESGRDAFATWTSQAMTQPDFGNARAVRWAIDRCRLRQARRIALTGPRQPQDLVTITRQDVVEGTTG